MKALILAAGFGTRLERGLKEYLMDGKNSEASRELVKSWIEGKPKGLVPVNGKLIVDYLLEQLEGAGFGKEDIYVHTNSFHYPQFKAWAKGVGIPVESVIDNGRDSNENRRGPIGDFYYALEKIGCDEPLLVLAQDTLVFGAEGKPYDLSSMVDGHNKNGNSRMVVYEGEKSQLSNHGLVKVVDKYVVEFEEKPEIPKSNLVNAFICIYSPAVLHWVKDKFTDWENYMDRNILEFIDFKGFPFEVEKVSSRLDIGKIEDVLEVNDLLK